LSHLKTSALRRCVRVGALTVASLSWAGNALCQSTSESAETLYQRGIAAFNAGDYVVACRSLSESYRLDPQLGALFTEATCEMRAGKTATAAQHYSDFVTRVDSLPPELRERQQERRAVAVEQRALLLPQIPTLRIELRGRASSRPQLTLDGNALAEASLGSDLPLDPGDHILEQRASSGTTTAKRITLVRGEHQTLVVQLAEEAPLRAESSKTTAPDVGRSRSALPYVLGGAGLVGLGVGGIAGMLAIGKKGIVNDECSGTSCTQDGLNAANSGKRYALVSSIGFGVGIAGLGAGLVLLLTAPEPPPRQSHSSTLVFAGDRLLWRGDF
jgi:hypothetical protein